MPQVSLLFWIMVALPYTPLVSQSRSEYQPETLLSSFEKNVYSVHDQIQPPAYIPMFSYSKTQSSNQHLSGFSMKVNGVHMDQILIQEPHALRQEIVINNKKFTLLLVKSSWYDTAPQTQVNSTQTAAINNKTQVVFYQGIILEFDNAWCTFSVDKDRNIQYFLAFNDNNIHIHSDNSEIAYGYYSSDVKNQITKPIVLDDFGKIKSISKRKSALRSGNCIELYIETDYATFLDFNQNVENITRWIMDNFNNVATVFALHDVPLVMNEMHIRTTPDPYANTTNIADLKDLFVNTVQNNYSGRIAQLWSTRNLGGGIAHGIGGFCDIYPAYPGPFYIATSLTTNTDLFPSYGYNTYLIAHEIGHVMGLRHTHACVWNENDTQIDDCGNVYAQNHNETPEGISCYDSNNPIMPTNGGTIMSNCHLLPNYGVNLNLGFGPIAGHQLYENFVYAPCMTGTACQNMPPINDNCFDAILLTPQQICQPSSFLLQNATDQNGFPPVGCGNAGVTVRDIWFRTIVPSSGQLTIETTQVNGGLTDMILQVFSGTDCSNLTLLGCDDNSGISNHAQITISGQMAGDTLWIRTIEENSDQSGLFGICAYDISIPCHPDFDALIDFYNNTNGPNWTTKSGWDLGINNVNCDVCTWHGISCDSTGRVVGIQLNNNNLSSTDFPSSITDMNKLRHFSVYNNNLNGTIPTSIDELQLLNYLDIGHNNISGSIPENLGNISKLKNIYLDNNSLTGQLPNSLPNINVSLLYAQNNMLSGCIPAGYQEICAIAHNLDGNPNLGGGVSFSDYCMSGDGGDEDMDGYCQSINDCNDADNTIYNGAPEICDDKDNDCNGLIDDISSPSTITWGGSSGLWSNPSLWQGNVLPQSCDDVILSGNTGTIVTISAGMLAEMRSLTIMAGITLFIENNGQINIVYGTHITNHGLIENNGIISIENVQYPEQIAFENMGTVINNSQGVMQMSQLGDIAMRNHTNAVVTNSGNFVIDHNNSATGQYGLENLGHCTNNGIIHISNITGHHLKIGPNGLLINENSSSLELDE